jgi:uncharacterized protein YqfA (UPF0365 family)
MVAALTTATAAQGGAESGIDWGLLQPPPNFMDNYAKGYELARKMAADRAAAQVAQQQAEAERRDTEAARATARNAEEQRQVRARTAGRLIADRRCPDARSYALTEGDLDLALQVAKLCPYAPTR